MKLLCDLSVQFPLAKPRSLKGKELRPKSQGPLVKVQAQWEPSQVPVGGNPWLVRHRVSRRGPTKWTKTQDPASSNSMRASDAQVHLEFQRELIFREVDWSTLGST